MPNAVHMLRDRGKFNDLILFGRKIRDLKLYYTKSALFDSKSLEIYLFITVLCFALLFFRLQHRHRSENFNGHH